MKIPGELKLSTITDQCTGSLLEVEEVGKRLQAIACHFLRHVPKPREDSSILLLESASSTSTVS